MFRTSPASSLMLQSTEPREPGALSTFVILLTLVITPVALFRPRLAGRVASAAGVLLSRTKKTLWK